MNFADAGGRAHSVSILAGDRRGPAPADTREVYGLTPASTIRGTGAVLVSSGKCRVHLPGNSRSAKGIPPPPPSIGAGSAPPTRDDDAHRFGVHLRGRCRPRICRPLDVRVSRHRGSRNRPILRRPARPRSRVGPLEPSPAGRSAGGDDSPRIPLGKIVSHLPGNPWKRGRDGLERRGPWVT